MLEEGLKLLRNTRMTTRRCKTCQKDLDATLENFQPSKTLPSGLDIYCRECRKSYARRWYEANREKEIQRSSKWNRENPDKVASNMRKCRERRPDHYKEYQKQYRKENPALYAASDCKKRSIRRSAIDKTKHKLTTRELASLKKQAKGICYYCGKKSKLTLDHIIPLSRGGTHSRDNVLFACNSCNCSKGAKDPNIFAQTKGFLLV